MKIDSSVIGMESARSYTSIRAKSISYRAIAQGNAGSVQSTAKDGKTMDGTKNNEIDKDGSGLSFADFLGSESENDEALSLSDRFNAIMKNRSLGDLEEQRSIQAVKAQCVQYLLYWLFGGRGKDKFEEMFPGLSNAANNSNQSGGYYKQEMEVTYSEYYSESEQTSYQTTGKVVTADGREIEFNLGFSMSRSFEEVYTTSRMEEIVQSMDPLVINLDGNLAGLSDQKFEFDLDDDGILDSISMLEKGSGYLALDKNGDGIINNGSELFGTKSGDGFSDLTIYDEDGNGWIDENDEIFSKLLIWSKDSEGNDELYTLKEAGVGAINLQKVSTDFSMKSLKDNHTNGQIRSTGIFLYENGNVGTIQQMDLAI